MTFTRPDLRLTMLPCHQIVRLQCFQVRRDVLPQENLASVPSLDTFVPSTVQKPHARDVGLVKKQFSLEHTLSLNS